MNPLISVVIPTYNHANFLGRALQSVLAQTYTNWEIIVVDNHSQDNTDDIIEGYDDSRIRFLKIHNHGIIAASRNMGIREARGVWVAFLDSDDIWYPDKLASCVAVLKTGCDLICHGEVWVQNNTMRRQIKYGPTSRAQYGPLLYKGNCISTSACVVRKTLLERLNGFCENPDFVTAEDYDLWLRIAHVTKRLYFIPNILGEYTIHPGNASKAVKRNMRAEMAVIDSHFKLTPSIGFLTRLKRRHRQALVYYGAGRGLQKNGDYQEALSCFSQAWLKSPLIARLYVSMALNFIKFLRSGLV